MKKTTVFQVMTFFLGIHAVVLCHKESPPPTPSPLVALPDHVDATEAATQTETQLGQDHEGFFNMSYNANGIDPKMTQTEEIFVQKDWADGGEPLLDAVDAYNSNPTTEKEKQKEHHEEENPLLPYKLSDYVNDLEKEGVVNKRNFESKLELTKQYQSYVDNTKKEKLKKEAKYAVVPFASSAYLGTSTFEVFKKDKEDNIDQSNAQIAQDLKQQVNDGSLSPLAKEDIRYNIATTMQENNWERLSQDKNERNALYANQKMYTAEHPNAAKNYHDNEISFDLWLKMLPDFKKLLREHPKKIIDTIRYSTKTYDKLGITKTMQDCLSIKSGIKYLETHNTGEDIDLLIAAIISIKPLRQLLIHNPQKFLQIMDKGYQVKIVPKVIPKIRDAFQDILSLTATQNLKKKFVGEVSSSIKMKNEDGYLALKEEDLAYWIELYKKETPGVFYWKNFLKKICIKGTEIFIFQTVIGKVKSLGKTILEKYDDYKKSAKELDDLEKKEMGEITEAEKTIDSAKEKAKTTEEDTSNIKENEENDKLEESDAIDETVAETSAEAAAEVTADAVGGDIGLDVALSLLCL